MTKPSDIEEARIGAMLSEKYRVHRLLGAGGMGRVYEAEHLELGKRVAVKFLHVGGESERASLERFRREARTLCAVESDHVVKVLDWGSDEDGAPFIVMELLEGRDLAVRIAQFGRLSVAETCQFVVEALRGLRKVHQAGIVHRDLKPENLFLVTGDDERLHVKIVDFGLSKLAEPDSVKAKLNGPPSSRLTLDGTVLGTPLYMAPEQIEGVLALDSRADLWALGVIAYEMLAGSPPFVDQSYARLVMAICQRDPLPLSQLNAEVTPELEAVVARAMARDREKRWSNADEFLHALLALEGPAPTKASPSSGSGWMQPRSVVVTPRGHGTEGVVESSEVAMLDATIASRTRGAATVWLTDAPVFSLWRGEVDSPDRLRIETRDGSVRDLRLEPMGSLKLGRSRQVGDEVNELVYPDVASRLAARLEHDGVRWWLERREECSVPVQVGTRALERGERAPLVHGTFVAVGAMRAALVDRRYVTRAVPTGTVDGATGLLARPGLEQEVATSLQQGGQAGLVLVVVDADRQAGGAAGSAGAAVAVHRSRPAEVVARCEDVVALLVKGDKDSVAQAARAVVASLASAGHRILASGAWCLQGDAASAGREVELALNAVAAAAGPGARGEDVVDLRASGEHSLRDDVGGLLERARSPKTQLFLFGLEDQCSFEQIGVQVVRALEQELAAVIETAVGPGGAVARVAPGVVAAAIPRKLDASKLAVQLQCEWHSRPPVTDGKLELPRSLSWEEVPHDAAEARAAELSRECADPHGVLSALSGGLPYPIAGRVHAAIAAESAVERVKMLFDVLEGAWRFIAIVLGAAYFAKSSEDDGGALRAFCERNATRTGLPLGAFRELARLAVKAFGGKDDPIGELARQVMEIKVGGNQTFDTLSNLMHSERNSFAHGHYNEARAVADLPDFEHMTRSILRALRPLCAWTLVTVQRTEPDLFGDSQTVEFIDHTGPHASGARRRFGFASPLRLANVVYLARWRDGLVLPLEPFVRRAVHDDRFELFWMDHLPRPGACTMSAVVNGHSLSASCDARRLPPLLRTIAS